MITTPSNLFNYIRGAVRGRYGREDLRGKSILFIGMDKIGQEVLTRLCIDDVTVYFKDYSILNYRAAHTICGTVAPDTGVATDIIIDFEAETLAVGGRLRSFGEIGKEPYSQGIDDFYCYYS